MTIFTFILTFISHITRTTGTSSSSGVTQPVILTITSQGTVWAISSTRAYFTARWANKAIFTCTCTRHNVTYCLVFTLTDLVTISTIITFCATSDTVLPSMPWFTHTLSSHVMTDNILASTITHLTTTIAKSSIWTSHLARLSYKTWSAFTLSSHVITRFISTTATYV